MLARLKVKTGIIACASRRDVTQKDWRAVSGSSRLQGSCRSPPRVGVGPRSPQYLRRTSSPEADSPCAYSNPPSASVHRSLVYKYVCGQFQTLLQQHSTTKSPA
jgi:hypothetical protein